MTEDCGCGHKDMEGKMAKYDALECAQDAMDVHKMIDPEMNLPEWLEAKITMASEYMNKVKDYLTHHMHGQNKQMDLKHILKQSMNEKIRKVEDGWAVYPKKGGKRLGTHSTKKDALKQLAAIEINKRK
tara:strand:- start:26 stop:412 length:387 start_codon:yes stop_codon:yes gene_type:complete